MLEHDDSVHPFIPPSTARLIDEGYVAPSTKPVDSYENVILDKSWLATLFDRLSCIPLKTKHTGECWFTILKQGVVEFKGQYNFNYKTGEFYKEGIYRISDILGEKPEKFQPEYPDDYNVTDTETFIKDTLVHKSHYNDRQQEFRYNRAYYFWGNYPVIAFYIKQGLINIHQMYRDLLADNYQKNVDKSYNKFTPQGSTTDETLKKSIEKSFELINDTQFGERLVTVNEDYIRIDAYDIIEGFNQFAANIDGLRYRLDSKILTSMYYTPKDFVTSLKFMTQVYDGGTGTYHPFLVTPPALGRHIYQLPISIMRSVPTDYDYDLYYSRNDTVLKSENELFINNFYSLHQYIRVMMFIRGNDYNLGFYTSRYLDDFHLPIDFLNYLVIDKNESEKTVDTPMDNQYKRISLFGPGHNLVLRYGSVTLDESFRIKYQKSNIVYRNEKQFFSINPYTSKDYERLDEQKRKHETGELKLSPTEFARITDALKYRTDKISDEVFLDYRDLLLGKNDYNFYTNADGGVSFSTKYGINPIQKDNIHLSLSGTYNLSIKFYTYLPRYGGGKVYIEPGHYYPNVTPGIIDPEKFYFRGVEYLKQQYPEYTRLYTEKMLAEGINEKMIDFFPRAKLTTNAQQRDGMYDDDIITPPTYPRKVKLEIKASDRLENYDNYCNYMLSRSIMQYRYYQDKKLTLNRANKDYLKYLTGQDIVDDRLPFIDVRESNITEIWEKGYSKSPDPDRLITRELILDNYPEAGYRPLPAVEESGWVRKLRDKFNEYVPPTLPRALVYPRVIRTGVYRPPYLDYYIHRPDGRYYNCSADRPYLSWIWGDIIYNYIDPITGIFEWTYEIPWTLFKEDILNNQSYNRLDGIPYNRISPGDGVDSNSVLNSGSYPNDIDEEFNTSKESFGRKIPSDFTRIPSELVDSRFLRSYSYSTGIHYNGVKYLADTFLPYGYDLPNFKETIEGSRFFKSGETSRFYSLSSIPQDDTPRPDLLSLEYYSPETMTEAINKYQVKEHLYPNSKWYYDIYHYSLNNRFANRREYKDVNLPNETQISDLEGAGRTKESYAPWLNDPNYANSTLETLTPYAKHTPMKYTPIVLTTGAGIDENGVVTAYDNEVNEDSIGNRYKSVVFAYCFFYDAKYNELTGKYQYLGAYRWIAIKPGVRLSTTKTDNLDKRYGLVARNLQGTERPKYFNEVYTYHPYEENSGGKDNSIPLRIKSDEFFYIDGMVSQKFLDRLKKYMIPLHAVPGYAHKQGCIQSPILLDENNNLVIRTHILDLFRLPPYMVFYRVHNATGRENRGIYYDAADRKFKYNLNDKFDMSWMSLSHIQRVFGLAQDYSDFLSTYTAGHNRAYVGNGTPSVRNISWVNNYTTTISKYYDLVKGINEKLTKEGLADDFSSAFPVWNAMLTEMRAYRATLERFTGYYLLDVPNTSQECLITLLRLGFIVGHCNDETRVVEAHEVYARLMSESVTMISNYLDNIELTFPLGDISIFERIKKNDIIDVTRTPSPRYLEIIKLIDTYRDDLLNDQSNWYRNRDELQKVYSLVDEIFKELGVARIPSVNDVFSPYEYFGDLTNTKFNKALFDYGIHLPNISNIAYYWSRNKTQSMNADLALLESLGIDIDFIESTLLTYAYYALGGRMMEIAHVLTARYADLEWQNNDRHIDDYRESPEIPEDLITDNPSNDVGSPYYTMSKASIYDAFNFDHDRYRQRGWVHFMNPDDDPEFRRHLIAGFIYIPVVNRETAFSYMTPSATLPPDIPYTDKWVHDEDVYGFGNDQDKSIFVDDIAPDTEATIDIDSYIEEPENVIPTELGFVDIDTSIDLRPEHFIEDTPKTLPDGYDEGVDSASTITPTYPDNMYIEGESDDDDNVYVIDMGDDSEYVEEIPKDDPKDNLYTIDGSDLAYFEDIS